MLRSMARAFASKAGGAGLWQRCRIVYRMKNTIATKPSAANDTIGKRIRPNHLVIFEHKTGEDLLEIHTLL